MGLSSAFIVPGEDRLQYLGRWQNSKRPVLVFVNTCYDLTEQIPENIENIDTNNGSMKIAYIGYLDRSRGAMQWADICRQKQGEVELLVAGECRDSDLASLLESTPEIKFLGMRPYLESLAVMRSSDAVALLYDPSAPVNRIAAPNKFYEALMVGTPVIVSKGMNLEKIVEEQNLGCVVDYHNAESLSEAVDKLNNPYSLKIMKENCREYYLNNFRLSEHIINYHNFYKNLLFDL
jgi:glycosyltransferase involved in cell wall biosynthesis